MGVQRRHRAPHRRPFIGNAVGIGIAEATCTDTVDRMRFDHAGRRAPDAGTTGQCLFDPVLATLPSHCRARHTLPQLRYAGSQYARRENTHQREQAQPLPPELAHAAVDNHQAEGDP
ncbi:hypothetical protein D3C73_1325980 [compost metagenome]